MTEPPEWFRKMYAEQRVLEADRRARDLIQVWPLELMPRERLGQIVRETWIEWAKEQPNPKPSWLVPWEGLSEPDREVDRRIGEAVRTEVLLVVEGFLSGMLQREQGVGVSAEKEYERILLSLEMTASFSKKNIGNPLFFLLGTLSGAPTLQQQQRYDNAAKQIADAAATQTTNGEK